MQLPDVSWEPIALAATAALVLSRVSVAVKRLAVLAAAGGGLAYALSGGFNRLSLPDLKSAVPEEGKALLPDIGAGQATSLPSIDWCALGLCSSATQVSDRIRSIWPEPSGAPGRSYYTSSSTSDQNAGRIRGYAVKYPLQVPDDYIQDKQP